MTSGDNACPACREGDGVCYEAEDGRFRIYCAYCGHSTKRYPDLNLARLDWSRRGDAADQ
ncbi:hypothetical protein Rumeso_03785 [Rubellimicrobium mesophilum DSM 19309]|uniref:Uncharacterized protein n=1 Tax=Rubellimicrobium mesophilum DSM 19309 TaxID=442562 RepID=A0A017HL32_9RHOB|nr:hypothetical protein [Rubellimicrobium mesophilum]EYD74489.1 hypothetical protein Rumeso_03785 [Rubellimicrobium mesophilum DSM 19309]